MKLLAFTLVLDGIEFLPLQLKTLQSLSVEWEWIIVHGAAMNGGTTHWCSSQPPRLSNDGTTEFLSALKSSPVVTVLEKASWESKDEMCNAALSNVSDDCVVVEIDVDELHSQKNLETIVSLFDRDLSLGAIRMPCRYFVGRDLVCIGENCWSNRSTEWERAWHAVGSVTMLHEPPKIKPQLGRTMERAESKKHGLTFDHMAYVTEAQVKFKQNFYGAGYGNVFNQWSALQANQHWPVKLNRFFPFVDDRVEVTKIVA